MKKYLKIIFLLTISFIYTETNAANNWHYTINEQTSNRRIEVGEYKNKEDCEIVRRMLNPSQDPGPECYESKPLKINKINPSTAAVGDFIEITGENFGQIVSVLFGTIPARNFTFTDKSIKVEIPNGVTSGNKITLKSPTRGETMSTESLSIGESNDTIDPSNEILWWFQNEKLQIVGIGGVFSNTGFRSENDCNTERIKYINDNATVTEIIVEDCFEEESKKIAILIRDQQNMEQYAIESKNRLQVAKTYKLLAPIGDFTEFDGNDIGNYLNILVKLAIGLCGALAVIMLIINGITYMGEGSIFKKAQAKDNMQNAILGLLIALGSWALLNTINPDLLGGKGLSVRQAKLDIDMEVHGDVPQKTAVNGRYCNNRIDANSEYAPNTNGRKWSEDAKERAELSSAGIRIQRPGSCTKSGQQGCTSLTGLDTSKVLDFKKNKCPSCEVVINGATECWLHSAKTEHFPGNTIVDFDDTPSMNTYVRSGKHLGKSSKGNYDIYEKDGIQFLDEKNHYHIIKW